MSAPMDGGLTSDEAETIRDSYRELSGSVPPGIEARITLAAGTGRLASVAAVEAMRRELIMENPLGRKVGQLVQFGQLLALGKAGPARLHAGTAHRAGASLGELVGVAELALITSGMPAYGLGVEIISELAAAQARLPAS